jgi:hypothetical protein
VEHAVVAVSAHQFGVKGLADSRLKGGARRKNAYEPLLLENEREAVADLLQYLESGLT